MSFRLEGVSYSYPSGRRPVFSGLDLTIPTGATTVILGPSGAGKSTLLYLLGLLWENQLDSGRIRFHDGLVEYAYDELDAAQRAALRQRRFGFVLQSSYLLPHLTCAQNVALPLALAGARPGSWEERVGALIRRADAELFEQLQRGVAAGPDDACRGLAEVQHRVPAAVSGGQRQRFAVLRAIVHDPDVVFADEPFSNLDELHTRLILDLLSDWRAGRLEHARPDALPRTLVLVCHDPGLAEAYADHRVHLDGAARVAAIVS